MMNKKKLLALFMAVLMTLALLPALKLDSVAVAATGDKYVLVTSADQLVKDKEYIIVSSAAAGSAYALSTTQNKNNRAAEAVTVSTNSDNTLEVAWATKVCEITLIDEGKTDSNVQKWALFDSGYGNNGGYLYAAGSTSNNYLRTDTKLTDAGRFTIEIDESSNAATIVTIDTTVIKNTMRFNSGSTLFSCYASGQSDIYLYKKVESTDPQPTTYTVTYAPGNANAMGNMSAESVEEGGSHTLLANAYTLAGYRFTGWSVKIGDAEAVTMQPGQGITVTADTTVTAQWTVIQYAPLNLQTELTNGSQVVIFNGDLTNEAHDDDFVMTGVEKLDGSKTKLMPSAVTSNGFPDDAVVLTVSRTIGADGVVRYQFKNGDSYLYADGTNVKLLTPTSEQLENLTAAPMKDTYFRLETADANAHTFYIKCDTATYGSSNTPQYLQFYSPYFTCYGFNENISSKYAMSFYSAEQQPSITTYTVSFNKNSIAATGTMDDITGAHSGDTLILPECGFTWNSVNAFDGWKRDGDENTYQAGSTAVISGNTTFKAQWKQVASRTYMLVTDVSELTEGGHYLIASVKDSNNKAKVMSYDKGNNRHAIENAKVEGNLIVLKEDEIAKNTGDTTHVYELTLGGGDGAWTFYDPLWKDKNTEGSELGGFLYAASKSNNYLRTRTDNSGDNEGQFTITISDTNSAAAITATGENTNNVMRYNSSKLFACYNKDNSQADVYLYKRVELEDGYYLIGPNWSIADINVNNKFETNPENESEQLLYTTLSEGNEIKVVQVQNGGIVDWYPDGLDNQYHVDAAHAGYVAICFKPNYDGNWSTFGGYMWIEKVTTPAFRTQAAVLSDKIGVRFFVDLNMLTEQERNASYMTFAISGRGSVTDQNIVADSTNKKGYKGFTCKVNAIQMADTITATLHYGDGQTIEKTYSVKEYIEKWDELYPNDTSDTTKLIHALADYGHYAQIFLSAYNHWEIGNGDDQYASMSKFYTNSGAFDEAAIKASALGNQPMTVSRTGNPDTFLDPTMSLALDSETAIRVHFSTADGSEPEFTVKDKDNHDVTFTTRKSGSTYVVEIAGVKAKWLLNEYTVTATLGEDTQTVGLSAATYVGRMLSAVAYDNDQTAHDVVCALWNYAQLAANYNG